MVDLQLDCQGLNCPMPIVELTKAARGLGPGKRIEVTATDLAFRPDLEAWARRTGHTVDQFTEEEELQRAVITLV
ncbi:sulfur transfer protein SirA [Posidoniimonas polymericola]|uniref:Sulfur transfer protein SirA n=1 Tax=Posidoniimonas polymericola TaxID=2528002 RepID=A0A5C5YSH4_9BACT|nr:sulfurtransferase TusA family protein [Posidoniimonas polymericola]TWT77743.1 sulfur transfer protein SirA [Posidoniimonas polymericola]